MNSKQFPSSISMRHLLDEDQSIIEKREELEEDNDEMDEERKTLVRQYTKDWPLISKSGVELNDEQAEKPIPINNSDVRNTQEIVEESIKKMTITDDQPPQQQSLKDLTKKSMPLKHKVMLGPIAKYKQYNRFPWKLIICFILIAITSFQVLCIIEQTGQYQRAVEGVWYKNFLDSEDFARTKNFFKFSEVTTFLAESRSNYIDIVKKTNDSFDYYEPLINASSGFAVDPLLTINFLPMSILGPRKQYPLTTSSLGPFTDMPKKDLKNFMREVLSFEVEYKIRNRIPELSTAESNCYVWLVGQNYDYSHRSIIKMSIAFEKSPCSFEAFSWHRYPWVMYLSLFFAGLSLCLHIKYLIAVKQRYEKLRRYYSNKDPSGSMKESKHAEKLGDTYARIQKKNTFYLKGDKNKDEFSLNRSLNIRRKELLKEQHDSDDNIDSDESMTIKLSEVDKKSKDSFFEADIPKQDHIAAKQSDLRGTAKFKQEKGISKNESIDSYLETNQSVVFDKLGMTEEELRHYENREQLGMYMREHQDVSWNDLSFWDKAKLINKFSLLSIVGNICQLMGTSLYFLQDSREISVAEIIIGFGCLFAWSTLPRYFMYSQRYSLILRTIQYAVPVLARALLGIMPFFIGYAILGQCLFWEIEMRFGSFGYALFSLFAMMNGDNLIPIHNDVIYARFLLGNLYIYVYVFLSIVVIMNIFIPNIILN